MKFGNVIVEQVDTSGEIVLDFDTIISPNEIFVRIKNCFPNVFKTEQGLVCGEFEGHKFAIRSKNITYLGNPHPKFKKRIQISDDLQEFYIKAQSLGCTPILLGVYTYGETELFCDFNIEDYISKKAHNSSAHVYSGDLANAMQDGIFQKIDFFGNKITVFKPEIIDAYLRDLFDITEDKYSVKNVDLVQEEISYKVEPFGRKNNLSNSLKYASKFMSKEVLDVFDDFFEQEQKQWNGIECYKKMIESDYRNKYQPEWAGFFLEYEFEYYIKNKKLNNLVTYAQDKTDKGIDLDLYFPTLECYGDLKAHSDYSKGIQGNDWDTVFSIIDDPTKSGHIYYVVCEHSTVKDKDCNYEVTYYWNKTRNKENLMSYSSRMKNSIELKKAYILDINKDNKQYLTMFKQGVNSNGQLRAPKIMIEHDKLDKFLIKEWNF